jgi:hypothetical protein
MQVDLKMVGKVEIFFSSPGRNLKFNSKVSRRKIGRYLGYLKILINFECDSTTLTFCTLQHPVHAISFWFCIHSKP